MAMPLWGGKGLGSSTRQGTNKWVTKKYLMCEEPKQDVRSSSVPPTIRVGAEHEKRDVLSQLTKRVVVQMVEKTNCCTDTINSATGKALPMKTQKIHPCILERVVSCLM